MPGYRLASPCPLSRPHVLTYSIDDPSKAAGRAAAALHEAWEVKREWLTPLRGGLGEAPFADGDALVSTCAAVRSTYVSHGHPVQVRHGDSLHSRV